MSAPQFQFDVVTLDGKAYSGEVESLVVPGEAGYFGILANHAAFIAACRPGRLKVRESGGNVKQFQTGNGFFEVAKNHAVLLVDSAA